MYAPCQFNMIRRFLLIVFLLGISMPSYAVAPVGNGYVMGVFPFLPAANLEGIFAPISAEVSEAINRPVKLRLSLTYDAFINALRDETFDIVHMHPFDYVRYGRAHGYIPLVARSEELYAVFSVKSGSKTSKISELRGLRVGTPPETGAITYLALDALRKSGLTASKDVTVTSYPNHFACLQQLQIGSVDACATSLPTLRTFESQFGLKFKRVGTSLTMPHTMFAVHKRVPASDREQIRTVLLGSTLSKVDPHLRELFIASSDTQTGNYFRAVTDSDYEQARRILKRLGIKN